MVVKVFFARDGKMGLAREMLILKSFIIIIVMNVRFHHYEFMPFNGIEVRYLIWYMVYDVLQVYKDISIFSIVFKCMCIFTRDASMYLVLKTRRECQKINLSEQRTKCYFIFHLMHFSCSN